MGSLSLLSILSSLDAFGCVTTGGPNTMGVSFPAEGGGIARGGSLKEKGTLLKSSTVETGNVHNTVQVLLILLHTTK